MTRELRAGVIGFGTAGSAFHAPIIDATPGAYVAAIVTRDPQRAAIVRSRYGRAAVVESVDELWGLGLDWVTVATPNSTHVSLATAAIEHGVPVVVDKPLATSALQAAELVGRAASAQVPLTVYLNRRWDGDFLTVTRLVREGSLGRVARFESRFERWRPQVANTWKETAAPGQGGGILWDLGPHVIDQALQLFGPAKSIYAEVDTTRSDATNPDDVFIAMTHAGGVRSHLWLSAVAAQQGPRFRVLGTDAAYTVYGLDPQEAALRAGEVPHPSGDWGESSRDSWGRLWGPEGAVAGCAVRTRAGDYPEFYRRWVDHLRGLGPVPVAPEDAVAGLEAVEAAETSTETASVVSPALPSSPAADAAALS